MKAIDFLEQYRKMCLGNKCTSCPISEQLKGDYVVCEQILFKEPQIFIDTVQKWNEENGGIENARPDTKY